MSEQYRVEIKSGGGIRIVREAESDNRVDVLSGGGIRVVLLQNAAVLP